jgi:histidine triad (HIT) family protein
LADECIFCKIIRGEAEASLVYGDEKVVAFLDIQPVNPGHVLVVPKAHAGQLADLEPETGAHLFKVAIRIDQALRRSGVRCEGVNLHLADGAVAGQEVFHVHLHVIPRFAGDGFGLKFGPNYRNKPNRASLQETATRVKSAMPE